MNGRWYIAEGKDNRGPLTDEELANLVHAQVLKPNTLVWCPGFSEWKPAGEIPGLLEPVEPPPLRMPNASSPEDPSPVPPPVIDADFRFTRNSASRRSPLRSYVVRHWRGDLSLPVSYWINSVLGTIGVILGFACVGLLTAPADSPLIFAVAISVAWLFAIATTLWQLVGVWRSAGKHKGRGGSGFWAGTARLMVILGFLGLPSTLSKVTFPQIAEFWRIAAGDPDTGKHELHILRGGTELEYAGGITFGATDDVRKLLDADPAIRVVHINSAGGRVAEARKLRDLIRERKLVTYTASACASACTIAFMGGVQRFGAPTAKLGFHRGSFPGVTDEELAQENDADRRWLIGIGVPAWFADRAYSTPSDSMWWPTSDELKRAGIITGIARPDDFALSGFGPAATDEDTEGSCKKFRCLGQSSALTRRSMPKSQLP
jgi:hypothetical protein